MDNVHIYTHDWMGSDVVVLLTVVLCKILEQKNEIIWNRYENVESFKYLGPLVTSTDEDETEIQAGIAAGSKYYHSLGHSQKKIYIYT